MLFDEIEQYCDVIRYIVDGVKDRAIKISILYGSGLSIKSGNLNSYDICKAILNAVNGASGEILLSKDTIEQVLKRTIQLEDFLMRLFDDLNFTNKQKNIHFGRLFKILYSVGKPNTYHYFLAELFKKGVSTRIYTTNFDTHFETALETQGFKEKYSCIVIDREFDSKKVEIKDNPDKLYFKLHGCISKVAKPELQIATLLPYVASKANIDNLKPILKDLFLDGTNDKHEIVLVLGYSFSDAYDISKIIMEMNKKEDTAKFKDVIVINYAENMNNETSKPIPIDEFNGEYYKKNHRKIPMKRFPIKIFNCDTNKFVEELWNELHKKGVFYEKYDDYIYKSNDKSENTIQQITDLFKKFHKYYIYLMAWRFNYECGQDLIIYNNNKTLSKPDDKIDDAQEKIMECSLKRAKDICKDIDSMQNVQYDVNMKHLAIIEVAQGNFDDADAGFKTIINSYNKKNSKMALEELDIFNLFETLYFKYDRLIKYNSQRPFNELNDIIHDLDKLINAFLVGTKEISGSCIKDSFYKLNIPENKCSYSLSQLKNRFYILHAIIANSECNRKT